MNELQLTDDQKTRLQPIFKDAAEKARTLATEVESLQGQEDVIRYVIWRTAPRKSC